MAYNLRPRPGVQVETLGPMDRQELKDPSAKDKDKDWSSSRVLGVLLVLRWVNVALVQTSFAPDEYWQSLEVAHRMVFEYGYLTWEWQFGLRGYAYPAMFAALYKILAIFKLDYPLILIYAPRVLQASLSAIGDFCLYRTSCRLHGRSVGRWTLVLNLSSWFVFYNATRTLSNTMETTLTCIGLYLFPWPKGLLFDTGATPCRNRRLYIMVVALACLVRPTAAVLWLPLCLWHIHLERSTSMEQLQFIRFVPLSTLLVALDMVRVVLVLFLPVGLLAILLSLGIDGLFYGKFVFVQKNFVEFNLIHDLGTFYGSHPWHWYFTQGFPVVMATHIPCFLMGAKMAYRKNKILLFTILWTLCVYSLAGHKEFRFIYPVVPICMLFCGIFMEEAHRMGRSKFLVCYLLLNVPFCAYFGLVHQRGVLDVMGYVRHLGEGYESGLHRSVSFLMPCHSTPYYSFVHRELPMRFLECPPNFNQDESYVEEAAVFYDNPRAWLEKEYHDSPKTVPTHLIFFDILKPAIHEFLLEHHFQEVASYFHMHLPEGRMGRNVLVYEKGMKQLDDR